MIGRNLKAIEAYFRARVRQTVSFIAILVTYFFLTKTPYVNIFLQDKRFLFIMAFVSALILYRPSLRQVIIIILTLLFGDLVAEILPLQYIQEYFGIFIYTLMWYIIIYYIVVEFKHHRSEKSTTDRKFS